METLYYLFLCIFCGVTDVFHEKTVSIPFHIFVDMLHVDAYISQSVVIQMASEWAVYIAVLWAVMYCNVM